MPARGVLRALQLFKSVANPDDLAGVNAPVATERYTRELAVEGSIPPELNGLYIRTGGNNQHPPVGGYHVCAPAAIRGVL
jgi:carotenoid cleavage dioxygenase-like enzyme